ncbi:aldose epimerase family protein [Salibacterium halotolerans]|uniref:Aldose 1-epimerase n=1 Tax=Salibacterium halotolerans TaxID=1884432 RepID=A0A1I5LI27_9BACI|nr:aldose epimerase family protein [Salibacterium halotolerans]SFO97034.1 aldose 1-epimerase [Salibacterium halotolerans]
MIKEETIDHWDGEPLIQITMEDDQGVRADVLNFGCRIRGLYVPDKDGKLENVVLAYNDPADYRTDSIFLGAVIGRTAGRIPYGRLQLGDDTHHLSLNEGDHHLHGGTTGFSHRFWNYEVKRDGEEPSVSFHLLSVDGEEGYPGRVDVTVTYTLERQGNLTVEYEAVPERTTWISLTNHTYFNLSGNGRRKLDAHALQAPVECVFELDDTLIPTGTLIQSEGTPFDVREQTKLSGVFGADHPQLDTANGGFDHFFVFEQGRERYVYLSEEESGRTMKVETTEPGAVVYTGNKISGALELEHGKGERYAGICIETQRLPEMFRGLGRPTCLVQAGEAYKAATTFSFGTQ